ncbi:MAG: YebC/PmpR family DNA-binding transcriptional regulator [Nitrospirae bacterium CG18_big_fil_WC_8_21_14_2_50_70_55]|nr:YebC/PmpR family DNA-binding transcriptional regulator [Deltaproteobacteria bacterium]OIP65102.1 MAG: transcriptional regulator [Nitrospirae bacterium CG2_30_70_394]PIQ04229.1 MAG: YebC/PmpR family DNA-binding transcriptional regulator [Nitrospirae bacterium CG18_big_fil_WC_8_21_14_2_50_70_55]PIU78760.1 MAG: YebC/PmpR family DNA-binding transcriptional regulator [Nitrospirae bacterium CG06_land_8_20_14_3_00_70_43]PIW81897.1 MAG: YebC/PmpR family DNA-binding transcriptional regulator [Nitrosp
MSGHSKWATTKHKKAAIDSKRGKVFTKILREISVAARIGGGDPAGNPRLRAILLKAKAANMPAENIVRGIKKGTGELEGVTYEEVTYEGFGPGGVAILIEGLTDNRNRTVAEIRHAFTRYNGNMGENGSVSYLFDRRGVITFARGEVDVDGLMEAALEAGAEDVVEEGESVEVRTAPAEMERVKEGLEAAGFTAQEATVAMVPKTRVPVDEKTGHTLLRLFDALDDSDDVNEVYSNEDIPDEVLASYEG